MRPCDFVRFAIIRDCGCPTQGCEMAIYAWYLPPWFSLVFVFYWTLLGAYAPFSIVIMGSCPTPSASVVVKVEVERSFVFGESLRSEAGTSNWDSTAHEAGLFSMWLSHAPKAVERMTTQLPNALIIQYHGPRP